MAFAERGRLVYQDDYGLLDLPLPKLVGAHQVENAGLAVAALRRAGVPARCGGTRGGPANADWPARMQRLKSGPLVDEAPAGSDIWLDGGHNPGAGAAIAQAFAEIEDRDPRPLILICGMLTSKDPAGFFKPFAGLVRHAMTVPVPIERSGIRAARLAEIAMQSDVPARAFRDVRTRAAVARREALRDGRSRILICGSLYLAGGVLKENGPLPGEEICIL